MLMWVSLEVVWAWNSAIRPKITKSARNKLGYVLAVDQPVLLKCWSDCVPHITHTLSKFAAASLV